ncbi:hypothetical protein B0H14DRAFT_1490609 [Mycena olivaceomarginata]|nr:hypothetical protein B0H14DRAFT_1490609 [Mycena olivaceomarginata]
MLRLATPAGRARSAFTRIRQRSSRHAGPNPPARAPAPTAREYAPLQLLPPARARAPVFFCRRSSNRPPPLRLSPFSPTRTSRPSGRTTPSVWRPSYASPSSTSYTSPSTHSTHTVAFPVSPHRSFAPRPRPTPAPTYVSTLSPPTPPGVPPMVRSVSSPPAPVRTSLAPGGKPRSSALSRGRDGVP